MGYARKIKLNSNHDNGEANSCGADKRPADRGK
jgi:hypothetical protein